MFSLTSSCYMYLCKPPQIPSEMRKDKNLQWKLHLFIEDNALFSIAGCYYSIATMTSIWSFISSTSTGMAMVDCSQKLTQQSASLYEFILCTISLQLLPSKDESYFPTCLIMVGFVSCFSKQNTVKVMLRQFWEPRELVQFSSLSWNPVQTSGKQAQVILLDDERHRAWFPPSLQPMAH